MHFLPWSLGVVFFGVNYCIEPLEKSGKWYNRAEMILILTRKSSDTEEAETRSWWASNTKVRPLCFPASGTGSNLNMYDMTCSCPLLYIFDIKQSNINLPLWDSWFLKAHSLVLVIQPFQLLLIPALPIHFLSLLLIERTTHATVGRVLWEYAGTAQSPALPPAFLDHT